MKGNDEQQTNSKPKRQHFPPRRPIQKTRRQRQREERWERRLQRWKDDLRELRLHVIKSVIGVIVVVLMAQLFGLNTREAIQQLLDSFAEFLNRLG